MQYNGVVKSISSKEWNGKLLWSFQLNGNSSYFRCGDTRPKAEEGSYIEFDAITGKDGKSLNVTKGSIQVKSVEKEASGVSIPSGGTRVAVSKDDYWSRKEDRDLVTQARIERQSTRNSAIEFIKVLIGQEALKVPQKNKVEFFEELLAHYQEKFIKDNSGEDTSEPVDAVQNREQPDETVPY